MSYQDEQSGSVPAMHLRDTRKALSAQNDIAGSALHDEALELFEMLRCPGTGTIITLADLVASGDGEAIFTGGMMDRLEGLPYTRICTTALVDGDTRVLTHGPGSDRLPRVSPDGAQIAFLSDRARSNDFQLYLLDKASGTARPAPTAPGWVESLQWSPRGNRILLGVAGHGADVQGGQGAVASEPRREGQPDWAPQVESGGEDYRWRRAWTYAPESGALTEIAAPDWNIWEACWCGEDAILAVASHGPSEGLWYTAVLLRIDVKTGRAEELFAPRDQIGLPAAAPSGSTVAIVEAICSDRGIVAGELRLIDTATKTVRNIACGIDVTHIEWCSDDRLLVAGHRGFETVVGTVDSLSGAFVERWASDEITSSGRYATVAALGSAGDCLLAGEGYTRAPEIGRIVSGQYETVRAFVDAEECVADALGGADPVVWRAPDGLEIQGWLLRPRATGPFPLVMHVHGGPVYHWRPVYLGRVPLNLLLLRHGYAVFLPNPRGSSGRGRDFIRPVIGDVGGAETDDLLSGLDHLVAAGIADAARLGVTGGSHGGYMSSWLVTQDQRFAAAVPVCPVTNWTSEHLLSNIPHFVELFLDDQRARLTGKADGDNRESKYITRSPVSFAGQVKTPVLNICGALDRCTPAVEAAQFHSALREGGASSVLVTYPKEGHGIRNLPAAADFIARTAAWFEAHMPAPGRGGR